MAGRWCTLIAAIAAGTLGCAGLSSAPAADYAFVDVAVVKPESGALDTGQTVLIRGAQILAVGAGLEVPPGARRIDASGQYLVPGLAEMHAHVPRERDGEIYRNDVLFMYVANGITTMRGMQGEASHLALRERIARNELIAPRLITAGPAMIGKNAGSPTEAAAKVAAQATAGYDFVKVHMGLSAEVYDAIATAAARAGLPIAGHVAEDVGLERALAVKQASIDHLDAYWPAAIRDRTEIGDTAYGLMGAALTPYVDSGKFPDIARATAAAGVWNAPTLSMIEKFARPMAPPDALRYMPPKKARGWIGAARSFQSGRDYDPAVAEEFLRLRLELVKALHDAGAGLLLASDAPQVLNVPGFSIHRELELMVEAGLTPAQAIAAGTSNAARFLDRADEFGRIAPGLSADLVLVATNPFQDVSAMRNPLGVMLRGRWLSASQISKRLGVIAQRNAPASE